MYLGETEEYKEELAMIIEEFLKQRILGMKNKKGTYIAQAFPKLLYVLEEDNIHEDSKYWYLTELAAECTNKRMVPDYISEKIMKEYKIDKNGNGQCYPCMGCIAGKHLITYKYRGKLFVESFERMWLRCTREFEVKHQYSDDNPNLYMDLEGVQIYDTKLQGFTTCHRIIRNISNQWVDVNLSGGRRIQVTPDHPFETENRGVVQAANLQPGDTILTNYGQYSENNINVNPEFAWTLGFVLCDGSYRSTTIISIAATGEDEVEERYSRNMQDIFGIDVKTILRERGTKGTYKDVSITEGQEGVPDFLSQMFAGYFEGIAKNYRHIPNEVFEWNYPAKLAFLAGMIDADGYIDANSYGSVQIGSVNQELALQQLALAQTLGMKAKLYHNHYNAHDYNKIRYQVEFFPTDDLLQFISCKKKVNNANNCPIEKIKPATSPVLHVKDVILSYYDAYSYDVTTQSGHFEVSNIYSHNCRSFLTPYVNAEGKPQYYGRFNQGVVSINLPHAAMSSGGDFDKFWEIMEERLELCHRALQARHERISGITSDAAPILWQDGAFARLKEHESVEKLLHGGYSTISLGYAGLYECVKYMTGYSHTDEEHGLPFAIQVLQKLNDKCKEWKEAENIDYSVYGTPIESVTYKFAKSLKKFPIVEDINDKDYVTNSYHCSVTEQIDAFTKLKFEGKLQKLSPGGCISYVEVPSMKDNTKAIIELIKFMYDHTMYAEINTKLDWCQKCGYEGEIEIKGERGNYYFECPNCGNTDEKSMNITRRVCGLT
jgi:hypothetical protein